MAIYTLCKASLLFTGEIMYRHDAFKHLSFFAYFIDNFQGLVPPTWSPFTHSGEPFYLYIPINGLLHPAALLSVLVHRLFPSVPFVTLNMWEIFSAFVFYSFGCHLLFCRLGRSWFAVTMANTAIIFGTTGLSIWQQLQGALDVVAFLPWIVLSLLWAFKEEKWHYLIVTGIFFGAAACTYIPVFVLYYLAVTIILGGVELILRRQYPQINNSRGLFVWLLAAGCATAVTALPALALFSENSNLVPIARLDNQSSVVQGGVQLAASDQWVGSSFSTVADLQAPFLPSRIIDSLASELSAYIGLIPLALALIGFLAFRRRGCPTLIASTVVLVLTAVGPLTPFATWVRHVVPGFSFIRHVFMFSPFIAFNLAILCLYGVEALLVYFAGSTRGSARWYLLAMAPFIGALLCWSTLQAVVAASRGWILCLPALAFGAAWLYGLARHGALATATATLLVLAWVEVVSLHILSQKNFSAPRAESFATLSSTDFHYNPTRYLALQPALPPEYAGQIYIDNCVSMGEPLLFSVDTAFFADNLRYFMLRNYYEFTEGVFNAQDVTPALAQRLGLESQKLELIPNDAGTVSVAEYLPNSISLDFALSAPARLLYRNVDDGHWQLFVDGQRQGINLQDNVFPVLDLAAGKHSLTLKHRPWMFLIGFYGLVGGYLILLLALAGRCVLTSQFRLRRSW